MDAKTDFLYSGATANKSCPCDFSVCQSTVIILCCCFVSVKNTETIVWSISDRTMGVLFYLRFTKYKRNSHCVFESQKSCSVCNIVICLTKLICPMTRVEKFLCGISYSLGSPVTNRELIAWSFGRHFSAEAIHFSSVGTLMDRPKWSLYSDEIFPDYWVVFGSNEAH